MGKVENPYEIPAELERFITRRPGFDYLLVKMDWTANKNKPLGVILATRERQVVVASLRPNSHGVEKFLVLDRVIAIDGIPVSAHRVAKDLILKNDGKFAALVQRPTTPETKAELQPKKKRREVPTKDDATQPLLAAQSLQPETSEAAKAKAGGPGPGGRRMLRPAIPKIFCPPDVLTIMDAHLNALKKGTFSRTPRKGILCSTPPDPNAPIPLNVASKTSSDDDPNTTRHKATTVKAQSTEYLIPTELRPDTKVKPLAPSGNPTPISGNKDS